MRRKKNLLFVPILCGILILTACGHKVIGEDNAKEAGLAIINQTFGVNETEAEVEYRETAGSTFVNGVPVQYGSEEPVRTYRVTIPGTQEDSSLYSAEVNAVTGFAYRAEKSESLLSEMTEEQQKRAEALSKLDIADDAYQRTLNESNPAGVAADWVTAKLHPGVPTIATLENGWITDNVIAPRVCLEYTIVFKDGAVYEVTLSWPTMEVQQVSILSQSVQPGEIS